MENSPKILTASPLDEAQLFIYDKFVKHRGRMQKATWEKYYTEGVKKFGELPMIAAWKNLLHDRTVTKERGDLWWAAVEKGQAKKAKAEVTPVRQRTQYTCMSTSMMMCLQANGLSVTEDEVNNVMGARPQMGATWDSALACAQYFGNRATLTCPSTVSQLKGWTDAGVPVMIAWNPENRDWSHASVVFDVDDDGNVSIADPNIPDPDETVRVVPKAEFYGKWFERYNGFLLRRPACAIEREVTADGRQTMASIKQAAIRTAMRTIKP